MNSSKHTGFTLVELAVVLLLVGIMGSIGLTALTAQMANATNAATQKKHEVIKEALSTYLRKNKRLPCPATTNTGLEDRQAGNPGVCTGLFGILPYATLDLPKSVAIDGWENLFSYAVSARWTLTYGTVADPVTTTVAADAFGVGADGDIIVKDRPMVAPYTPETTLTSNAVVLIISHGKNGLGAYTSKGTQNVNPEAGTDELANVTVPTWVRPAAFYLRNNTDNSTGAFGAFDDNIQRLSANTLIEPLIREGALKSPEAMWEEQIADINNTLIGDMFLRSRCSPLGYQNDSLSESAATQQARFITLMSNNDIPTTDPWGGTLTYTAGGFCRLHDDGRYKTSSCDNNCGTCYSNTIPAFTITTTTPSIVIKPQMLTSIISAKASLLAGCPNP